MRVLRVAFTATVAAATLGLLAGCSGNGSSMPQSVAPSHTGQQASHVANPTGVAPKFASLLRFGTRAPQQHAVPNFAGKHVGVSDFGTAASEILNGSLHFKFSIPDNSPDGNWYDASGNYYDANYAGPYVNEFAPNSSTLIFTYSAGLGDPIAVTTDEAGNVYVGDYGFGSTGFINEYAQGSNTVINSCSPGGGVEGLAVSETGVVYVTYNNPNTGTANLAKYPGLAGCHEHVLTPVLGFAGGMTMANNRTLVACDQFAGVDLIPPPYTSISTTINPGYSDPFHVALDKGNLNMYVADVGNAELWQQAYPSGTVIATVTSGNQGISDPAGVAIFPFVH